MAMTQQDFRDAVMEDLGEDVGQLLDPLKLDRWVNRGKDRLGAQLAQTATLNWNTGDTVVDLPSNFKKFSKLVPGENTYLQAYSLHGFKLHFDSHLGAVADGTAILFYYSNYPDVTDLSGFDGPEVEGQAIVCYVLYRFYSWLASSRLNFRRYAVITGNNGVDVRDLAEKANEYRLEFEESRFSVDLDPPESYYGD